MSIAKKRWHLWVQRLSVEEYPLKHAVQKLLSIPYCCDCKRACRCSASLEMGPGRFQEVYPEIQGHQIAFPFLFPWKLCSEICVQSHGQSLMKPNRLLSRALEFSKEQEYWVLYHNNELLHFFQEKNSVPNAEGFLQAGIEGVVLYIVQKGLWWRRHTLLVVPLIYQLCFSSFLFLPTVRESA